MNIGGDSCYLPDQQADHLPRGKTFSIFFLAENKRLTKNCGLNANDLETSEVPYLTLFCIKTKERFVYLQIYKKSLINTLIY